MKPPSAAGAPPPDLTLDESWSDTDLLGEVAGYYHRTLRDTPEALAYLEKRGLTHPELIDSFQLGYADRSLGLRLPRSDGKPGSRIRGRLQALGVMRDSGHEHMRGSLVIPICDARGAVVDLYGRKIRRELKAGTIFHSYLAGPRRGVFNLAAVAISGEVIVAGSLIDALTFWCAGYRHVTAAYGPDGFTDEMLDTFVQNGVRRVLIAFGRTAAGDEGAGLIAERLAAAGIGAFRINFPRGMDANAYALAVTPAAKSLGVLIRGAAWLAGSGERAPDFPEEQPVAPVVGSVVLGALGEDVAPHASPLPQGPPADVLAKAHTVAVGGGEDVVVQLGERLWRARGLERNASLESLKVNLMVRQGEAFHVDGLDLLSAKSRMSFVTQAAVELTLPVDVIKRDVGLMLLKLEAVQAQRLEAKVALVVKAPPTMTARQEEEALAFLKAPDLLERIGADVASIGVVGETANAQAVYLAALSRKLDKPLAVLIQSTSAAGKSALMDAVLDMVPPEERVSYSAMTGQSLFYLGEGDLRAKVLAIAEEEGVRQAAYALKLLQSQGALTIASTGKDPATGKLITQDYLVQGPVALMLTTTAIDLDEELKNRCLVLTIDESRDQTRAIHQRQRFEETLEGLQAQAERSAILALHHDAQRLLKPLKVVNPFARHLTFLDDQTRTRRDHRKYLALIRAIALLRQHQRPIKHLVRQGAEPVAYIEAAMEDIADAGRLAHAVLGTTLDELPPQTRRLLGLVRQMVLLRADTGAMDARELHFTRREVRDATGWGDTQLKVHLGRLLDLEYLFLRRTREGERPGRHVYELAWAGEGEDGAPFVMGLIDPAALSLYADYDADRSGAEAEWSRSGRAVVGVQSADGLAAKSAQTFNPNNDLRPSRRAAAKDGRQEHGGGRSAEAGL